MGTVRSMTRTNYFAVKDKPAFYKLVDKLVTNDGKAFVLKNSAGEVGFAADGAVLGLIPDIPKDALEQLKMFLRGIGREEIENFVGGSVEGWEKDAIERVMDKMIEQSKANGSIKSLVKTYTGVVIRDPEPDEMEMEMIRKIQELIEPGHACIITEISWENLKYMDGQSTVITQNSHNAVNLAATALGVSRDLLGNQNYCPDMAY